MADKIWKSLSSTRLAIILLIILTVVSVVGIIIPQELQPVQYLHKLGSVAGGIVLTLKFDHVFSAIWFYALLGLLSLNLIACIITRLLKNLSRSLSHSFLAAGELGGLKHQLSFSVTSDVSTALAGVARALRKQGFRVQTDAASSRISARKGSLKEVGSILFHCSIILLFIGGLVGKFGGFSILQELKNGQIIRVPDRTFLVRSDWFKMETNEKGEIKDYKTKLSLLRPDSSLIRDKIIEVNDPLVYEGVRFYQASYGKESEAIGEAQLHISAAGNDTFSFDGAFAFQKPVVIPNTRTTLEIKRFLGDFVLEGEANTPALRSREHENPAILVSLTDGNGKAVEQWIFLNYPNVHESKGTYRVAFLEYTPLLYTGLQVKYNPGLSLIWTGILLMTFGILAMFYISKRSIWVVVKDKNGKSSNVSIGGMSDRPPSSFQKGFEGICRSVQKTIEEGGR